jgi:hypothetical protein
VRVRAVLEQPRSARIEPDLRHRHRFTRPVDDFGAVECKRPHRLRVLAVAAANRPDVPDVLGPQDRVERLDAVAE